MNRTLGSVMLLGTGGFFAWWFYGGGKRWYVAKTSGKEFFWGRPHMFVVNGVQKAFALFKDTAQYANARGFRSFVLGSVYDVSTDPKWESDTEAMKDVIGQVARRFKIPLTKQDVDDFAKVSLDYADYDLAEAKARITV